MALGALSLVAAYKMIQRIVRMLGTDVVPEIGLREGELLKVLQNAEKRHNIQLDKAEKQKALVKEAEMHEVLAKEAKMQEALAKEAEMQKILARKAKIQRVLAQNAKMHDNRSSNAIMPMTTPRSVPFTPVKIRLESHQRTPSPLKPNGLHTEFWSDAFIRLIQDGPNKSLETINRRNITDKCKTYRLLFALGVKFSEDEIQNIAAIEGLKDNIGYDMLISDMETRELVHKHIGDERTRNRANNIDALANEFDNHAILGEHIMAVRSGNPYLRRVEWEIFWRTLLDRFTQKEFIKIFENICYKKKSQGETGIRLYKKCIDTLIDILQDNQGEISALLYDAFLVMTEKDVDYPYFNWLYGYKNGEWGGQDMEWAQRGFEAGKILPPVIIE